MKKRLSIFKHSNVQAGFTLVELMVSLSLFIIIVLALIGTLYTVNDASRRVQAMRTVMDNLNFATESMSRTIRTGTNIGCGAITDTNCPLANNEAPINHSLSLDSTLGSSTHIVYQWVNNNGRGELQEVKNGVTQSITAPEINIQQFAFYVDGASPTDGVQPNVIIKMEGVASIPNGSIIPFALQTYLSQRTPE